MYTLYFLSKRKAGTTVEAFRAHYAGPHKDLALKVPGVKRYVVSFVDGGNPAPEYDAITELAFDDAEAFQRAVQTPEAQAAFADQPVFCEMPVPMLVVQPQRFRD
jgi:uncharacterized protein (TIGR02118 family)